MIRSQYPPDSIIPEADKVEYLLDKLMDKCIEMRELMEKLDEEAEAKEKAEAAGKGKGKAKATSSNLAAKATVSGPVAEYEPNEVERAASISIGLGSDGRLSWASYEENMHNYAGESEI